MTPATIIREAQADGVRLALSPAGTIKVTGDGAAVNRWLATIRERKAEIIDVLKVGAGGTAMPKPDPFLDDRRSCLQCLNLVAARCQAARRGEIIWAGGNYEPIPDQPRRCEGYAPGADDPDRRPGRERWPGLASANKVAGGLSNLWRSGP
jgi:hypothetical protein